MIRALIALVFLAAPAVAAVDIQEVKTPGGITAWLVEEHSIPFVALEIRFRGGASLDAPGKRGAINLMTGLIEEGAGEMDSRAFAEAQEGLAARFGFDVGDDSLSVSARFLTENRDQAVDLLRLALTEPRFDQNAIDRVRAQVISIIRSDATDPEKIASRAFQAAAWGDHPYGSDLNGTVESVQALTRDDIVDARLRAMARDRVFVGVVGDITAAELAPLLDRLLGGLPATGAPMPPRATYQLEPGVTVIDWESPQSVAVFGHEGIALDDPDYFAAYVANEALGGGGFGSRLMEEVREKRGLTYGIGSYLLPMDLGELVLGQVASANERMAETLDVVRAEWARIAGEGLTEKELADAKTFLTGAYPLRFDGNDTIAGILVGMQMNGFPLDYAETRNQKVEAVTMEDVRRVAQRLYRPDALGVVVVGRPVDVATGQ
jgi:zinc protease